MPKLRYIGRVLPTMAQITLPPTDTDVVLQDDSRTILTYRIRISKSIINIECEPTTVNSPDRIMILANALALTRLALNLVSFAMAQPLQAMIDSVIDENGVQRSFAMVHSLFKEINTVVNITDATKFNNLYHAIMADHEHLHTLDILNDLRVGISEPVFQILNLYRAVEGIKQDISDQAKDSKKAWMIMREILNIGEEYLTYITDASKAPRHGRIISTEGKVTLEVARRAWVITNRYLEYISRGRKPLSITEFPLLQQ